MTLQHDNARRQRRREAAARSRERRDAAHLTVDQARVSLWPMKVVQRIDTRWSR